jgi:hypothetical protein
VSVPSRNSKDRCLECGNYDLARAPRDCVRCGLEDLDKLGYQVFNITELNSIADNNPRLWGLVADHYARGWIKERRFYVYVGIGNGALGIPMGNRTAGEHESFLDAWLHARDQGPVYEQVWIITSRGVCEIYGSDLAI